MPMYISLFCLSKSFIDKPQYKILLTLLKKTIKFGYSKQVNYLSKSITKIATLIIKFSKK